MPYKLDHFLLNPQAMTLVDTETNQLVSRDEKLITALTLLASRAPNTVTKDELMAAIWPNQILTEWSLTRFIADARQLLGARHHIKTVHGKGYRYVFPVEEITGNLPSGAQSPIITDAPQITSPVSTPITKGKARPSVIYSLCFLAIGLCLLIIYLTRPSFFLPQAVTRPQIAILPASIDNGHPAWQLGIPALIAKQLSGAAIDTTHTGLVSKQFEIWRNLYPDQPLDSNHVKKFCADIGCNQLLLIHQQADLTHTEIYYQIITPYHNKISTIFTGPDLHHAMQLLWEDLKNHYVKKDQPIMTLELKNSLMTESYIEALGSMAIGDFAPARMLLGNLQQKHPDFVMANLTLANINLRENTEKAKKLLQNLDVKNPHDRFIFTLLQTQVYLLQADLPLAKQSATDALAISSTLDTDNSRALALINKGMVNMASGQSAVDEFSQAETFYKTTGDIHATSVTRICLADALEKAGEAHKANQLRNNSMAFFEKFHFVNIMTCNLQWLL
jgi:DNA-binding winged helix-turn-helix (wHTH) protein